VTRRHWNFLFVVADRTSKQVTVAEGGTAVVELP
jgi:hypothetical protein